MRYLIALLLLPLLTILPAKPVYAWTAAEIRAMPPYCAGKYGRNENMAEYKRWEQKYGSDFIHVHHLCDGIGHLHNYHKAGTQQEKKTILNNAKGTLEYMIHHARPTFALMPDVYFYRSQVFYLKDDKGGAIRDLYKAIELDPKYAAAYVQAAGYLSQMNRKGEALKLISEGLRRIPGTPSLQKLYKNLGGEEPFPEPYHEGSADPQTSPISRSRESPEKVGEPKSAVFDFNRHQRGGRNVLKEAGANVLVEIREDSANPASKVRFRITSRVPQATARINQIGIDMGSHRNLFTTVQVHDSYFGKYYPMVYNPQPVIHAFLPDFRPTFSAIFTIDPKERKKYDPRALPPGSTLTLVGNLGPGKRIEDVIRAMQEGLQSNNGLRFGIVVLYTRGVNQGVKTLEDDGGFLTGSLRQMTGFDQEGNVAGSTGVGPRQSPPVDPQDPTGSGMAPMEQGSVQSIPAAESEKTQGETSNSTIQPAIGSPSNPWCRFCP